LKDSVDSGLGEYVTIHITPEPEFSYVSFESNVPATSYLDIVHR
jgi:S-adenosylmethionine decarboxylase